MNRFKNKTAVITGAGRGIGAVIATDLIAEGAKVHVPDLDGERSRISAEKLGPSAISGTIDVSSSKSVRAYFEGLQQSGETVDFLVNCAGGYVPLVPSLDITEDDLAEVVRSAKRIAMAAMKAFDAEGIIIQQFSEAASGQVVFHLHMHVMPVKAGIELLPPQTRREDPAVLADHARRMISALGLLRN